MTTTAYDTQFSLHCNTQRYIRIQQRTCETFSSKSGHGCTGDEREDGAAEVAKVFRMILPEKAVRPRFVVALRNSRSTRISHWRKLLVCACVRAREQHALQTDMIMILHISFAT